MKTRVKKIILLAICIAATFITLEASNNININYEWGTEYAQIKKALPSDKEWIQFTPRERPNYKNKIMSYIAAIDDSFIDKILILRVRSKPEVDYLFVNNKLYTIMEDWGEIDARTENEIQYRLTNRYGKPQVQQDKNFFIYSYNNDTTKVLFYLMKVSGGKSKCKVYYYTRKLFKMLITE